MDKEYIEAIKIMDGLYKELYKSDEVTHRVKNKYAKFDNIKSYIDRLERIHNKAKYNNNFINMLKKYYYDKYVIKPENIPDSYYNHQQQLYFERGYGRVEITDEMKKEYQRQIINDQKKSLDIWLDYFFSDDSNYIPMWAKFWSFQGMLKLGPYNKETGKFNKREDNTTGVFADLNREALAISIDYVRKMLNKEKIDDESLEKLVKSGSFKKIYEYVLNNLLKSNANNTKSNEGIWIKYHQGSDHMPLVKSLQGYNTGWCTAGEATAKSQLKDGDFYVYYTKDENNEYKIPRIAIRMEGNEIGEIRGVAKNQNIEPSMEKVVEEKIKDFPDKDRYYKKVHDMKYLTYLYELNKNGGKLSKDDLEFLYEINEEIQGFGYGKDPRIDEIKKTRNPYKDLSLIYQCNEDEIALNQDELFSNPNKIVCLYDNIETNLKEANFPKLRYIIGNADFWLLRSAKGLENLQYIAGYAEFSSLTSDDGLDNLQSIGKSVYFSSLKSVLGLGNLRNIGESAYFRSSTNLNGFNNLVIGEEAHFESLTSLDGLENITIGGKLYLNPQLQAEYEQTHKKL